MRTGIEPPASTHKRGHVQQADNYHVRGWAVAVDGGLEILDVVVDDKVVARIAAGTYSAQLAQTLGNDGFCAFDYAFEPPIALFRDATLELRAQSTGLPIVPGPQRVPAAFGPEAPYSLALDADFSSVAPTTVRVGGAVLNGAAIVTSTSHPAAVVPLDPGVTVSGFRHTPHPDDPGSAGWAGSRAQRHGIHFDAQLPSGFDSPLARFRVQTADQPSAAAARESLLPLDFVVPLRRDWHTIPPPENMGRISGSVDESGYVMLGAHIASVVDRLIRLSGLPEGGLRILDWGVGCGRVSVPLQRLFRRDDQVYGVDIDATNIAWDRSNLPDLSISQCDLYPPLEFPDGHFDFIFGTSVMTHLSEAGQQVWLRELRRVLKPGGAAFLTIHGEHTLLTTTALHTALIRDLARYGLHDASRDIAIEVDERGYYRRTFQLRGHVMDRWAPVMPIVAYLPRALGAQDGVLLRRP